MNSTEERIWDEIRCIQERHRVELKPWIDMLVHIEALKPPTPIYMDFAQLTEKERAYWQAKLKEIGGTET